MTAFYITAAVVCLLLSALFSLSEMALSSANLLRLENMAENGSKPAAAAVKVLNKFDDALSALLIGNNFVNVALSSVSSLIAILYFGEDYTWLATVIVTVAVIIIGETIPKIIAKKNANRLSLTLAPFVRCLSLLFWPLTRAVVALVDLIVRPAPQEETDETRSEAVEELQTIIDIAENEEVLDEDVSELLRSALDFDETAAYEVMTARVDMLALDIEDDWEEQLKTINAAPYSRIPVYEGSVDNIIGILYLNRFYKALLEHTRFDIRPLLMPPCFVYKTVKLPEVFSQLKRCRQHLAIVTDEYGGCLGVITMEDVLEQIVGDIWDESDTVEDEILERRDGVFELDGDLPISDLQELLDIGDDELETVSATVGGWTIELFGGFPRKGDSIDYGGLRITVLEADDLRVERVLIQPLPQSEN
ncbi:MAG: hemolysin family protein [Oscillospiraceae bacterium]|nr:hemolysin family protein [Oscillospiraceae bacterium]